jgi:carbon monoxide dehydrogenase subunit G
MIGFNLSSKGGRRVFMSELSTFTARTAKLTCSAKEFYDFVTDVRNFKQFISAKNFSDLKIEKESMSFHANVLGKVTLSLVEKTMYSRVVFRGENQQVRDFSLIMDITDKGTATSDVTITFQAELNPVLKTFAAAPVKRFLDLLADEMENFKGWEVTRG